MRLDLPDDIRDRLIEDISREMCKAERAMKSKLLLILGLLLLPASVRAQWQNITYSLKAGWNSIYLHGDANHDTIDNILVGSPTVQEIWRWNPNPNPAQFQIGRAHV